MSRIATDWAWSQKTNSSSQKLILLSLADRADENHCCFPCYSRISKDTGLNRKTIESNITKMAEKGFIFDTGIRKGRTKSIKVWQLNVENKQPQNRSNPNFEATPILPTSDPNFGVQNHPRNHPIEPVKEPTPIVPISENSKNKEKNSKDCLKVFDFWKTTLEHPRANLDEKRKKAICNAMNWGYSVEDLCQAIEGCSKTPFNMGSNDRGQTFDGLHVILKDADQIDRFIANSINPPKAINKQQSIEASNLEAARRFDESQGVSK